MGVVPQLRNMLQGRQLAAEGSQDRLLKRLRPTSKRKPFALQATKTRALQHRSSLQGSSSDAKAPWKDLHGRRCLHLSEPQPSQIMQDCEYY